MFKMYVIFRIFRAMPKIVRRGILLAILTVFMVNLTGKSSGQSVKASDSVPMVADIQKSADILYENSVTELITTDTQDYFVEQTDNLLNTVTEELTEADVPSGMVEAGEESQIEEISDTDLYLVGLDTSSTVTDPTNNVDDQYWGRVETMLAFVPGNVKNSYFAHGNSVHVLDNLSADMSDLGDRYECMGYTERKGNHYTIYLGSKEDYIEQSLVHEFGHYLDHAAGEISQDPNFSYLMLTEGVAAGLDSYYTNTPGEYFAQMFQEIMLNPTGTVAQSCPQTVAYINYVVATF